MAVKLGFRTRLGPTFFLALRVTLSSQELGITLVQTTPLLKVATKPHALRIYTPISCPVEHVLNALSGAEWKRPAKVYLLASMLHR